MGGSLSPALVHVRKAEIPENPNDLPVEIREGLESVVKASIPLSKISEVTWLTLFALLSRCIPGQEPCLLI